MKTETLIIAALAGFGVGFCGCSLFETQPTSSQPYNIIQITQQRSQYAQLTGIEYIRSQAAFDSVMDRLFPLPSDSTAHIEMEREIHPEWINFHGETLVLIPHSEGSISNRVWWSGSELKEDTLRCTLVIYRPDVCIPTVAFHCFALGISEAEVKAIEVDTLVSHNSLP